MALVLTLLAAGAVLLLLETIIPGMIAGVIGGICLIAGVILAFVNLGATVGLWVFAATVVGIIIGFAIWASVFPRTRMGRAFISERTIGGVNSGDTALLNQTGSAVTVLRPCGTALISGRRVDVVTEGGLIEKGSPLKVVAVEGMRVVVRASNEPCPENSTTNNKTT